MTRRPGLAWCLMFHLGLCLSLLFAIPHSAAAASHPGNIFLSNETVAIPLSDGAKSRWKLLNYEGQVVSEGDGVEGLAGLGRLSVGYYTLIEERGATQSVGVLAPMEVRPPADSPVRLDVGMAWLAPPEQAADLTHLCGLAGVSWVRDRFRWSEVEPARGEKGSEFRSDLTSRLAAKAGVRVLQVHHDTPAWAGVEPFRFAEDLRDVFSLHRVAAERWKGTVQAFEPWNEADIDVFGGHTGAEIASFQKAAYLGLKAGNRGVTVCQNVFATPRRSTLQDFAANQVWPYFDTFNFHHYLEPSSYGPVYASFKEVAGGRPIWVTECSQPVHWEGDSEMKELSVAAQRLQSERVAQMFASSIYHGAEGVFYFLLPHYAEGQNQFGILHSNLTPRPAYIALAAAARVLAGARPVGRLESAPDSFVYGFTTQFKGKPHDLLVIWGSNLSGALRLPIRPVAAFDHLGRVLPIATEAVPTPLSSAPRFLMFRSGALRQLALASPPSPGYLQPGESSPVVFQAVFPKVRTLLSRSAYLVAPDRPERIRLVAYNFSNAAVQGNLRATVPPGWSGDLPTQIALQPYERRELPFVVDCRGRFTATAQGSVRVEGDFGTAGRPLLAMRLQPEWTNRVATLEAKVVGAGDPNRWLPVVSGRRPAAIQRSEDWVTVEASPGTDNRWVYPQFILQSGERLEDRYNAVELSFSLAEGSGEFHLILDEENGSSYMADFDLIPKLGEECRVIIRLDSATWGATWSMPDPNTELDLNQVRSVRIGCNTKASRVRYQFKDLRWLRL